MVYRLKFTLNTWWPSAKKKPKRVMQCHRNIFILFLNKQKKKVAKLNQKAKKLADSHVHFSVSLCDYSLYGLNNQYSGVCCPIS